MFNIIWYLMILVSAAFAIVNGNVEQMVANIPLNAKKAFDLSLAMVGVMAFWLGLRWRVDEYIGTATAPCDAKSLSRDSGGAPCDGKYSIECV